MALSFLFPLAGHAGGGAFPAKTILVQVFNFSIFAGAFLFLIRRPLSALFHKRQKDFMSFEDQAESLEKEKRKEEKKWDDKLRTLREEEQNIRQKAEKEGQKFALEKKEELKSREIYLKNRALFFIRLESEKAKKDLLRKWKDRISQKAKEHLKTQADSLEFQSLRLNSFLKQTEKGFWK